MDCPTSTGGAGRQEDAETLAIKILNFIVTDDDRIVQFLNVTGLQPETIRESAKSSLFLLGVLDYVSKDEALMKAIHDQLDIRPAEILVAIVRLTPEPEVPAAADKPTREASLLPRRSLFH